MNTQRLNITIPKEYADRLRDKPNKSAYIAEAVREKLEAEDKLREQEALAKAYEQASAEETSLLRDWEDLAGDAL